MDGIASSYAIKAKRHVAISPLDQSGGFDPPDWSVDIFSPQSAGSVWRTDIEVCQTDPADFMLISREKEKSCLRERALFDANWKYKNLQKKTGVELD